MNVAETDGLTPDERLPPALRRPWLYLIPFVLFPLIIFTAAFFVVPTQWFALHLGNPYLANIGYAERLVNSDCQVVVYGDSSAITSVNPFIVEKVSGLKTCNIAEFAGMTAINGTRLVDRYLEHNPRPRYMVFVYNPENLRVPTTWRNVSFFEALTYRARSHDRTTLAMFAHHPLDMMKWAEIGMRMSLLRVHAPQTTYAFSHAREPTRGQMAEPETPRTSCDPVRHDVTPDLAWLDSLKTRYGVGGTTVIIDANPAPECDPSLNFFEEHLHGVIADDPLPVYPLTYYVNDQRNHLNRVGSQAISTMIGKQILERLQAATAVTPEGH